MSALSLLSTPFGSRPIPSLTDVATAVIGAVGRCLIGLGLVVLAFAAFQLWGTGLAESRAQSDLDDQFALMRAETEPAGPPTGESGAVEEATSTVAAPRALRFDELPEAGQPIGRLSIPAIGVEKTVVEGVARDDLRNGPGHYPGTSLPGQPGNAAIAGHRTTNGAPFLDIDQLEPGDEITVETLQGTFVYEVMAHDGPDGDPVGYHLVSPTGSFVLDDFGDDRLTLTACHPKYSAEQRIVVTATLVSDPAPTAVLPVGEVLDQQVDIAGEDLAGERDLASTDAGEPSGRLSSATVEAVTAAAGSPTSFEDSFGWDRDYLDPSVRWAGITAAFVAVAWALTRRRSWWARLAVYGLLSPVVGVSLFVCFTYVDRLIPAV